MAALEGRVRAGGGAPLLTSYAAGGQRTELAATSFAKWVDKTANLLDELGLDPDGDVALPVLVERPDHWMALVWPFALWQRGMAARVVPREAASGADLAVLGNARPEPVGAVTLACSLHPWGLPLAGLPDGVVDYAGEALAQPDAHVALPAGPGRAAWVDADRTLTFADLSRLEPTPGRILATPTDAWASVALLVAAVLGGGSLVLVADPDADLAALAASERAALRCLRGWPPGTGP